jgi:hypothetical protein
MFAPDIHIYAMKKTITSPALKSFLVLLIVSIIHTTNTAAQSLQLLQGGDIRKTGGFLLVDNPKEFQYWTVELGIMTSNGFRPLGNDGTSWSLWEVGHLYLKRAIETITITDPIFIRVRGYSLNNQVADEKVIPALDGEPLPMRSWHCNSYEYDYRLVETNHGDHLVYSLEDGPGYVWWPNNFFTVNGPDVSIGLQGYPIIGGPDGFLAQHGALVNIPNEHGGPIYRDIMGTC